jgi:hypothetical protein
MVSDMAKARFIAPTILVSTQGIGYTASALVQYVNNSFKFLFQLSKSFTSQNYIHYHNTILLRPSTINIFIATMCRILKKPLNLR